MTSEVNPDTGEATPQQTWIGRVLADDDLLLRMPDKPGLNPKRRWRNVRAGSLLELAVRIECASTVETHWIHGGPIPSRPQPVASTLPTYPVATPNN